MWGLKCAVCKNGIWHVKLYLLVFIPHENIINKQVTFYLCHPKFVKHLSIYDLIIYILSSEYVAPIEEEFDISSTRKTVVRINLNLCLVCIEYCYMLYMIVLINIESGDI